MIVYGHLYAVLFAIDQIIVFEIGNEFLPRGKQQIKARSSVRVVSEPVRIVIDAVIVRQITVILARIDLHRRFKVLRIGITEKDIIVLVRFIKTYFAVCKFIQIPARRFCKTVLCIAQNRAFRVRFRVTVFVEFVVHRLIVATPAFGNKPERATTVRFAFGYDPALGKHIRLLRIPVLCNLHARFFPRDKHLKRSGFRITAVHNAVYLNAALHALALGAVVSEHVEEEPPAISVRYVIEFPVRLTERIVIFKAGCLRNIELPVPDDVVVVQNRTDIQSVFGRERRRFQPSAFAYRIVGRAGRKPLFVLPARFAERTVDVHIRVVRTLPVASVSDEIFVLGGRGVFIIPAASRQTNRKSGYSQYATRNQ